MSRNILIAISDPWPVALKLTASQPQLHLQFVFPHILYDGIYAGKFASYYIISHIIAVPSKE